MLLVLQYILLYNPNNFIDTIKFKSSKENYLLFYYIINLIIVNDVRNQTFINYCIFHSQLLANDMSMLTTRILLKCNFNVY